MEAFQTDRGKARRFFGKVLLETETEEISLMRKRGKFTGSAGKFGASVFWNLHGAAAAASLKPAILGCFVTAHAACRKHLHTSEAKHHDDLATDG